MKKAIFLVIFSMLFLFLMVWGINSYLVSHTKEYIHNKLSDVPNAYTVVVLGARVYPDSSVSYYLQDRLEGALDLYKAGKVERFLLSGDHGTKSYDEVNTMKKYLLDKGVPTEDLFLDHAGFNTYNTMQRALKVFEVDKCIIVSQDYHLPRAVYIANKIGLEAHGFSQDSEQMVGIQYSKTREVIARVKSFFEVLFAFKPKFLGEKIPITGNSNLSYD